MQHAQSLKVLKTRMARVERARHIGRINSVEGGLLRASGLNGCASIGDRAEVRLGNGRTMSGEVVQLTAQGIILLPDASIEGVSLDDPVTLAKGGSIAPSNNWIGRIVDPDGLALDGEPLPRGLEERALRTSPPPAANRRAMGGRLNTGHLIFDTVLPIVKGQRVGLFAGSGVGKSSLMGRFAQRIEADVVVIAMIGERGREVRHFVDEILGAEGRARSVVIAATSDQSPLIRRRCAWTAMAVAEFFRDQGKSVLLLADSITRFAEAHREVAVAGGEAPVLRGFPPSTAHMIMSLCERAGPGTRDQGDITAVFSVLVAGSDMDEPVADILRGVLDGHVVLDRDIAERGRFPAVDVLRSVSRSLPDAATPDENTVLAQVRKHISVYSKNQIMISAGLYTQGADAEIDAAIQMWPALDEAMAQLHDRDVAYSFDSLKLLLRRNGRSPSDHSNRKNVA